MTGSTFQGVASLQPPTKNGRNSTSLPKFSERNNFPRHLQTFTSGFLLQLKQMNKTNLLTTLVFFLSKPHPFSYIYVSTFSNPRIVFGTYGKSKKHFFIAKNISYRTYQEPSPISRRYLVILIILINIQFYLN